MCSSGTRSKMRTPFPLVRKLALDRQPPLARHRRHPLQTIKIILLINFLLVIWWPCHVTSIRILMLDVPSPVQVGESVELACSYDMEDDTLYSVKWYKNDVEFFRYVPKDWPSGQYLPLPGVKVDLARSGKGYVYLKRVDINSGGVYRCEISAEAPSFNTAEMEKEMKVLMLPTEGPQISGGQNYYQTGEVVTVNCTSPKSKPAAQLHWYINDLEVSDRSMGETVYSSVNHLDGLEQSSLTLKFVTSDKHFTPSGMRLKCTSTVGRIYTTSSEHLAFPYFDSESADHVSERDDGDAHAAKKTGGKGKRKQAKDSYLHENWSQVRSSGRSWTRNSSHPLIGLLLFVGLAISSFASCKRDCHSRSHTNDDIDARRRSSRLERNESAIRSHAN